MENKAYTRPNYESINNERKKRFLLIKDDQKMLISSKSYYSCRPVEFIDDWCVTYDPRNAGTNIPTLMPFCLFDRQKEFITFLYECLIDQENGAIEKCRDVGATWLACSFSVWCWLFIDGSSIGWGSRKEQLVHKIGDPGSIFEKMNIIINNLPSFFKPIGFIERDHVTYMRIINPENHNTITGEAGDNIGRGDRKTMFLKDESSHYEHAEKIEAALGDNTNVQIDISSVNGPNTIFQRKIYANPHWYPGLKFPSGITRIFIFDWRDHPFKDQNWYDRRKAKAEREGLMHLFAAEVDRDASAAVEGTLIKPAWVKAAIDAHKKLNVEITGKVMAAFDVADGGRDKNALAIRKGILLNFSEAWAGEAGPATQKAIFHVKQNNATSFQYDSIGVGTGAKVETNRLAENNALPENLKILPWCAAASPLRPRARVIPGDKQSPINNDFYASLKSQAWWQLMIRFEKTFKVIVNGDVYPIDELISINSEIEYLSELEKELSQVTYSHNGSGKIVIDKNPEGTKSPNRADSVMMVYWPIRAKRVLI